MPIVILLLLAILIVLIGGPLALGFAVALPAYLVWASGVLQFLFWALIAGAGVALASFLVVTFMPRARNLKVPADTVVAGPAERFKCTKCGAERDAAFKQCFKCGTFKIAG